MANRFWAAPTAPLGRLVQLQADNIAPQNAAALLIDPSDVLYPPPGGGLLRVPGGGGAAVPVNGTANGQIWYYDHAAGLWVPSTAPAANQSPRWNAALNRFDWVSFAIPGELAYFDTSYSPRALYRFNSTLADFSGNGFDLTATAAIGYAPVFPGDKLGVILNPAGKLQRAANDPLLTITGDVSIAAILQIDDTPGIAWPVVSFGDSGETQPVNTLYHGQINAFVAPPRRLGWLSESGAGVDSSYTSAGSASLPFIHNVMFVGWSRAANVVQPILNGRAFGPPSPALITPDGGGSSRLFVGCSAGTFPVSAVLFTVQIIPRALNAAEWLDVYNRSMGPAFGILS